MRPFAGPTGSDRLPRRSKQRPSASRWPTWGGWALDREAAEYPIEASFEAGSIAALLDGRTPSSDPQAEAYRQLLVHTCNQWHAPMPFLFEFKRFVTTRCGEYFFMPSITALKGIAAQKY